MRKMAESLKVFLIEDEEEHAITIKKEFENAWQCLKNWKLQDAMGFQKIEIEWLQGSEEVEKRGKKFYFYTEEICQRLEDKMKEESEELQFGILIDVILTREEYKHASINDFSMELLAKQIIEKFDKSGHVYVITGLNNFGSRAWGLLGNDDMSLRYISKDLVMVYPSCKAIARALYWMWNGEVIPEAFSDEIEDLELREEE